MGDKTYYITTPIYYPSDNLHIGHAYTTVAADTMARFKRLQGYDVFFLTGSDEHGQKIQRKAQSAGMEPIEYVNQIVANFKDLWRRLGITHDDFIRTSEERHRRVVQELFNRIYNQGDIYKSQYEGWYCTPCETFWVERQLQAGQCPDCGRQVERLQEESYFFKMSKYAASMLAHIESHPDFIQPRSRRNEMINFIKDGLEDLCVSRTTFSWGIPVPFDERHVIYVWFDALTNYISGIGYGWEQSKFDNFWPADLHLVGKDIVRFHAIIWPIMLMAAGIPLPKKVFGHGWLLVEEGKMSKSRGNVVDPVQLIERYGVDAVRYFLLRELPTGSDGTYSEESLIRRINADLANDFGNLLSRTTAMINRFAGGMIPVPGEATEADQVLLQVASSLPAVVEGLIHDFELSEALAAVWRLIDAANKYIDSNAPWALAKQPDMNQRLNTVLYNMAETIRIATILLEPFMPATPQRVWSQLGLEGNPEALTWESARHWGKLPTGIIINRQDPIFPRIVQQNDTGQTDDSIASITEAEQVQLVSLEEFNKIDLRIAEIKEAKAVAKTDKLLQLTLDLGNGQRTVVAGIAQHYQPEALIGKQVVVVANLEPARLRGIASEGMVLAASGEGKLLLLTVEGQLPNGAKVR